MPYKWKDKKKEYHKEYHAKWYQENKEKLILKARTRRRETRDWLDELKSSLHCQRCPEDDPVCLDFHHRDRTEKDFSLYRAASTGYSRERILAEIAKCDVLCSNCHRKEHKADRGKNNAFVC